MNDLIKNHVALKLDEAWFKLNSLRNHLAGKRKSTPAELEQYKEDIIKAVREFKNELF